MCGHPANVSAKVARIINFGCEGDRPLSPAIQRDVPEATNGSWWITEAAIDDHHLETYQRLARRAEEFREDVWNRERQVRRAKYVLRMVEAEMKIFRIRLCFARMDMELVPVGAHNMEQFGGRSDEGADVGFDAEQERIGGMRAPAVPVVLLRCHLPLSTSPPPLKVTWLSSGKNLS